MKKYEKVKICLAIDASMDVHKEIIEAGINRISGIINKYRQKTIHVIEINDNTKKEYKVKDLGDIRYELEPNGNKNITYALKRSLEIKSDLTFVITCGKHDENINSINKKDIPRFIMWVTPEKTDKSNFCNSGFIIDIENNNMELEL